MTSKKNCEIGFSKTIYLKGFGFLIKNPLVVVREINTPILVVL
jgi:hypothetical protein